MSRKMTISVDELTEVDVEGIALVKRGANRIPFRIIKREDSEENSMKFNIKDLFKAADKAPEVPTIVGVILNKAASVEGYSQAITEAGFTILDSQAIADSEGYFLKLAEGLDDVDSDVLKINEDLALVITGLKKGLSDFPDSTDFVENLGKSQFFPGVSLAMNVLQDTVRNIAFSEEDNTEAVALLETTLADFSGFVLNLAKTIPASVAKFENMVPAVIEKADEEKEAEIDQAAADDTAVAPLTDDTTTIVKDETVTIDESDDEPKADEEGDKISAALGPVMAALSKMQDSLGGAIDSLTDTVKDQGDKLGALEKGQKDAVNRINKTEEDLRGTIPGGGEHSSDGTPSNSGTPEQGMFDSILPFAVKS